MSERVTPVTINLPGGRTMGIGAIIAIILGASMVTGTATAVSVHRIHLKAQQAATEAAQAQTDATAKGQASAVEQLTDLDLVEPLCNPEWLDEDEHGWRRLLCREALCWAQAQSTTTAAETTTCGSISNLADSVSVLQLCGDPESEAGRACLAVVQVRK